MEAEPRRNLLLPQTRVCHDPHQNARVVFGTRRFSPGDPKGRGLLGALGRGEGTGPPPPPPAAGPGTHRGGLALSDDNGAWRGRIGRLELAALTKCPLGGCKRRFSSAAGYVTVADRPPPPPGRGARYSVSVLSPNPLTPPSPPLSRLTRAGEHEGERKLRLWPCLRSIPLGAWPVAHTSPAAI